jgi:hypothetical protein
MVKKPGKKPVDPAWFNNVRMWEMERKLQEDRFGFRDMTPEQLDEIRKRLFG